MSSEPTSPLSPLSPSNELIYTVTTGYQPKHDGEIKLRTGDVISNVKDLGNGWALGQNLTRDRLGIFPSDCVSSLGRSSSSQLLQSLVDDTDGTEDTRAVTGSRTLTSAALPAAKQEVRHHVNGTPHNSRTVNSEQLTPTSGKHEHGAVKRQQPDEQRARRSRAQRPDAHCQASSGRDTHGSRTSDDSSSADGQTIQDTVDAMSAQQSVPPAQAAGRASDRVNQQQTGDAAYSTKQTRPMAHNDSHHDVIQHDSDATANNRRHLTSYASTTPSSGATPNTDDHTAAVSEASHSPTTFIDIRRVIAKKLGPQARESDPQAREPGPQARDFGQPSANDTINTGEANHLTTIYNDVRTARLANEQPTTSVASHNARATATDQPATARIVTSTQSLTRSQPRHGQHGLVSPVYDTLHEDRV